MHTIHLQMDNIHLHSHNIHIHIHMHMHIHIHRHEHIQKKNIYIYIYFYIIYIYTCIIYIYIHAIYIYIHIDIYTYVLYISILLWFFYLALFLRAWELGSKEIYDCVVHLPWGMMGSELRQGEPIATQITYMHIVQSKRFNLFMPIRSISSILYICHVCFTYDMETITCVSYITIHIYI